MERRSSLATRLLVCLVAVLLVGLPFAGLAAGAIDEIDSSPTELGSDEDDSALSESNESTSDDGGGNGNENENGDRDVIETADSIDETDDVVEGVADETTDAVEETADETTDTVEDSTEETTELVERTSEETTGLIGNTTAETTELVDDTTEETTDLVENTTAGTFELTEETVASTVETVETVESDADETVESTTNSSESIVRHDTGSEGDLETTEAASAESADGGTGANETATDDGGDESDGSDGSDEREVPSAATDAILIGLLGAITAGGTTAGSAGASGAAGATGSAVANWTGLFSFRQLRQIVSKLPVELLAILRYSRYDDSDPLENDAREAVYATILDEPGCYLSRVSERSGVSLSTVRHHVRVLEEEGMVTAVKVNGKRRYYLDATDVELRAALEEPAKRGVLETLVELGRTHNGRLADELDRDPSTVSHHLSALAEDGLVVRERDGRAMVNELAPKAEAALLGEAASDPTPSRRVPADD